MKSNLAKQLLGCLGTVLYVGSLSPMVLALDSRQTIVAQASVAQASGAQCNQQRNQVTETAAREWLERSRTYSQTGKPEQGAQALIRALQLTQRSPDMRFRSEMVQSIADDSPTGVLQVLVDQSVALQKLDAGRSPLPLMLQVTQTLPTAYSAIKTQGLTAVAKHHIRLGQHQQATGVLSQAVQSARFLQGAEFQTKALTAIAQQYAELGDRNQTLALLDQSFQFAQQVQHPNPLRRAWILQPIAVTYAKAGQFERAIQIAEMISDTDQAASYARNDTLAAIVGAYATSNQIDAALQLAERITHREIKAMTLARFAGVFGRLGAAEQSQSLLNRAIATVQGESNPGFRSRIFANVTQTYARASGYPTGALPVVNLITDPLTKAQALIDLAALETDSSRAISLVNQGLEVARQVDNWSVQTGLINQLIEAHISVKRYAIALQIVQSLPADGPFADRYSILERIAAQASANGELDIALQAIDAMPANWDDPRNQGLRDVAVGYAKNRQFDRAMQLFQRITNNGSYPYQVRTLAALADQAATQGDRNRANGLLAQALQIANRLTGNQKSDGLTTLAIHYARLGQADRAAQLRSQALQIASQRDVVDSVNQLRQMVRQYLNAQQYEYAVQAAIAIREEGERSITLNEIAAQLIEAGQFETAVRAANALSTPEDKTRFLVEVSHHYVADGNLQQASAILAQAFETAKTISGQESRQIVVREDLIVDDPFDRASFLEAIALKYADIGQYDRAMQVAQTLRTPNVRTPLLQRLACYR
ncbi:tetratricopeptide repeat protein [Oscillatoria sp. FACHB-1407]|uniref:tetratricopeptide repeat protein n=1 Tax=Oscillatoria sp. FACHB-1407 TaxID=2692847 RepID=UPI0016894221|nr:tetratricopeptide repeat protein [Oscillatoria sp. FACHB-1407]MBD2461172.1 tetratricopeptide repeat protein [Oscillatoria sp. FACHB-1407]